MWLPVTMGGRLLLRPARRMKPLPILSMVTVMPASLAQRRTRSRPCLSRSVRVRRHTPPLGVAPICASSISEAHRRLPLMRRLLMSTAVSVSLLMMFSNQKVLGRSASDRSGRQGFGPLFHGREVGAKGRALDIAPLAAHRTQIPLHEHQFALADGVAGDATHGAAFKHIEVAFAVLRGDRERLAALRVPHHQVCICAHRYA